MSRKSSIHFKPVSNIRFAVSHSERTDLSEPAYLLPKEHQLGNIVIAGSFSENELAALFIQQKEGMTGQAKARGSSPFWEGVVVLQNTNGQEQAANLQSWKMEYEKATNHKVLHMSVHLDEGYLDALGKPQYNPHAHVIVTRMNSKNRVINLDRKQLAKVQDLTASTLHMERGSTLAERQGKRGRAHIPHGEFRAQADEKRLGLEKPKADLVRLQKLSKAWSDADLAKVKDLEAKLDAEFDRLAAALNAQEDQINEKYRLDREAMKASGEAKQKDYKALKIAHEKALADLTTAKSEAAKVPKMEAEVARLKPLADRVPGLLEQLRAIQQETINTKLTADLLIATRKKEIENERKNHPSRTCEPTAFADVRDLFELDNLHDIELDESLLPEDAPDHIRPLEADPSHIELLKLGAEVARLAAQIEADSKAYRLDREALETKYKDDRAEYKASAEKKTQKDYSDLKTAHLGELAAQAKTHAAELATLKTKLAEAQQQAAKVPKLETDAVQAQAQINTLTPLAAKVPGLEKDLTAIRAEARKVPELVEQIKTLKPKADRVQGLEQDLARAKTEAAKVPQLETTITRQNTAIEGISPLRKELKSTKEKVEKMEKEALTQGEKLDISEGKVAQLEAEKLETDKTRFADMAKAYQEGKAAGITAHLIVPGAAPAPVVLTSQPNKPEVPPLGPNARAKLRAEQMAQEATRTAIEQPNVVQVVTPSPKPAKSVLELIADFVKGLVEKFGKQPSELVDGKQYTGQVLAVMDGGGAWAQRVSRDGFWVVHQGRAPELGSQAEVTFRDGKSEVKGMDSLAKGGKGPGD